MTTKSLVEEAGMHVQRQRRTGQLWKSYPRCICGWRGLEWRRDRDAWRQGKAHYFADHFERTENP